MDRDKGREILRRAVKSGLASVSIGIESVSQGGLAESGAWRKLPTSAKSPNLEKIREQIRIVQDHGVFVVGWFLVGWDSDGPDAYQKSLEFADSAGIAPVIANLLPMPGTRCYDDLVRADRIKPGLTWNDYGLGGGDRVVYSHPVLSEPEMVAGYKTAMRRGYSAGRILSRSLAFTRRRPGLRSLVISLAAQRGLRRTFGG